METLVFCLLIILDTLIAIPVMIFLLEVVAAVFCPARDAGAHLIPDFPPRVGVLIPAHDESVGLLSTLEDVKAQLRSGDRLLVVADNCTDDTAAVATAASAEVVERNDTGKIGKGYALDFGLKHLGKDPPDIVVMIDADCRLATDAIERLTNACALTQRPIQALYLLTAPTGSTLNYTIAEFSWRVKNWVRPLGLGALNFPCQLMGSGMAFPWDVIRSADLANRWIVEDLQLGLDLAIAGHSPRFCPTARLDSLFALTAKGAEIQRKRWEQGHLGMILSAAPRLIWAGISRGNLDLLALTLDLAVPPLSLLGLLLASVFTLTALGQLFGITPLPLIISAVILLGFVLAVFLSWLKFGRDVLPFRSLCSLPAYVLRKLPLYWHILSGNPAPVWTRTDRK
jgi:cellulose synthase/poly-beta-1,6-N-acetylglucosamine synthase-like glycosyltransferase